MLGFKQIGVFPLEDGVELERLQTFKPFSVKGGNFFFDVFR